MLKCWEYIAISLSLTPDFLDIKLYNNCLDGLLLNNKYESQILKVRTRGIIVVVHCHLTSLQVLIIRIREVCVLGHIREMSTVERCLY